MWKLAIRTLVVCSAWLTVLGCRDGTAVHAPPGEPMAVAAGAPARRVAATGRVEGWREADVTAKLPGRILRFEYDEGDQVEAGAPVVRLEDLDLRTRVRGAEARATEAARILKRTHALRTKGIAPARELDHAESTYLTRAAALDEARVMLEYATIKAPFTGTLMRKFKEIGESVTTSGPPDPLFRIADLSRLKVTAEVPENDIAAIRVGQAAVIRADAYPSDRFPATVVRIGLAVGRKRLRSDDPRERLDEKVIEVELGLPSDPRLKSGMTADVVFPLPND